MRWTVGIGMFSSDSRSGSLLCHSLMRSIKPSWNLGKFSLALTYEETEGDEEIGDDHSEDMEDE